jgi:arylsulfatase A-like enzyme
MNAALRFIRNNRNQSFFCYLPVTIPHAAMHAPRELHDKHRKLYPEFDDVIGKYAGPQVQNPVAAFPAMIECLDDGVGELLDLLDELAIEERTLVIFTSDNGAHVEGGHRPQFWDSNGPLRGHKRALYEGGIRAPMLARWKGTVASGSTSAHISAFWDMLPTFCEIAGAQAPDGLDGISMVPELLGKRQEQHDFLFWEFQGRAWAVRKGDFKAVVPPRGKRTVELYDLSKDLSEEKDIAGAHPGLVEEMKAIAKAAHTDSEAFPFEFE